MFGLTKTCRKAYLETLYMIYEENKFIFSGWLRLDTFQKAYLKEKRFMKDNAPQLRHINIINPDCLVVTKLTTSLACLTDGVRILEIGQLYLSLPWGSELRKNRFLAEMLQLRGLELKTDLSLEWRKWLRIPTDLTAAMTVLTEIVAQPKTGQYPLPVMRKEKRKAVDDVLRRAEKERLLLEGRNALEEEEKKKKLEKLLDSDSLDGASIMMDGIDLGEDALDRVSLDGISSSL